MRLLILGACGVQALPGIKYLANSSRITSMTLADLNGAAAKDLASTFKKNHILGLELNVLDLEALNTALDESDVVLNCTGPYHLLGNQVIEAAIDRGCTYVDYCDDHDATVEMLNLDQKAREKGVLAILGLGASPGMVNVCVAHAAKRLDEVHDVQIH